MCSFSVEKWIYVDRMCEDNLTGVAIYSVPDLILLKANQKYIDYWHSPFNIVGNCIGKSIYDIIPDWKDSESYSLWQNTIKTGKTLQIKELLYDKGPKGTVYLDVTVTPLYEDDQVKYLVSNSIDVTDRVTDRLRIEKQSKLISQQNEMLEAIIDNISDDLIIIDNEGNHIRINKSARDRFSNIKLDRADDVYNNFTFYDEVNNPIPLADMPVSYILRGEKLMEKKMLMKSSDRDIYFSSSGIPVFDNEGNLIGGVVCCRDITKDIREKQELEKSLIEQEEFFSNISHELKTPLNVILSALQVIDLYYSNEVKVNKYKKIMKQNCYRLLRLINNIIDMSKIDAGYVSLQFDNYNIVQIVEDISMSVAGFIEDKGLTLIFDTDIEEKFIACDPVKIERIILNLLSNAIKFTDVGGEIRVSIFDKDKCINIVVEDTGIGIPEDKLSFIFERFKQVDKSLNRNHEGSGVGLSLVKSLVKLHKGTIELSSKLGAGSRFSIMLSADTINSCSIAQNEILTSNKIERITLEFSDIYALSE